MSDWLTLASDAFKTSTGFIDSNYRKRWEDNISYFSNRHPKDSKYHSETYKYRSKIFRPKIRSVIRKNEAAAAAAFFSNVDVVTCEPANDNDPMQKASAEVYQQLLNYRLQKTIPWFITLIGAFQETQVIGVVCSYQYWKYKDKTVKVPQPYLVDGQPIINEDGSPVTIEVDQKEIIEDKPCIELLPIENIRFDAGADWTDPINTSPYVIRLIPMYVCDVKQMMGRQDSKTGQPVWKKLEDEEIRQAMSDYESIRNEREEGKEDSKKSDTPITDHEIAWVHENFMRKDGKEYVYYTMGTQHMLTDPKELSDVYFHGVRPLVIGFSVIEAHKAIPKALAELGEGLQKEANELANSRLDNVKLVLNKRWKAKRGKSVDIPSLMRNVAGSVTMVDQLDDVEEINWPDVTSSAYAEQDRLNVDFDELMGNFSQSSVMTNRQLNETVGGMGMMQNGASALTEYLIRTFVETWVEPVLRQLVKLEQAYETDEVVLGIVGQKAEIQKYGIDQITDSMLNHDVTVNVNVGMGATNPQSKMQKFTMAAQTVAGVMQSLPNADMDAVTKEVFGLAGYRDGSRFFGGKDGIQIPPQVQQQMQEMQQQMQAMQEGAQNAIQEAQARIQELEQQIRDKQGELAIKAQESQTKAMNEAQKIDAERERAVMDAEIELIIEQARLDIEAQKAVALMEVEKMKALMAEHSKAQQAEGKETEKAEGEAKKQADSMQMAQAIDQISQNMLTGMAQVIEGLKQPKKKQITMKAPSGNVYTGVVQEG
jgi:hypothetical protein